MEQGVLEKSPLWEWLPDDIKDIFVGHIVYD